MLRKVFQDYSASLKANFIPDTQNCYNANLVNASNGLNAMPKNKIDVAIHNELEVTTNNDPDVVPANLADYIQDQFIQTFSEREYKLWINTLIIDPIQDHKCKIYAPNFFVMRYIETNYLDFIRQWVNNYLASLNITAPPIADQNCEVELDIRRNLKSSPEQEKSRNISNASVEPHALQQKNKVDSFSHSYVKSQQLSKPANKPDYIKPKISSTNKSSGNNGIINIISEVKNSINVSDSEVSMPNLRTNLYYTFSNFVVGASNQMAYHSAFAIASSTPNVSFGRKRTPLFIHGPVGTGKTHLLRAIANYIEANAQGKHVLYISAQEFMYEFIHALKSKLIMEFKAKFRSVDVLMIDDIQFMSGKDGTQSEFFSVIDVMMESGQQLIVCADRSPYALEHIQDRIKSRLSWGLIADLQLPDQDLKLQILKTKLSECRKELSDEILEFLASNVTHSIRELEGALNKLISYQDLCKVSLTLKHTKEVLKDMFKTEESAQVLPASIISYVALNHNIAPEDITGVGKSPKFSRPRQVAVYLIKRLTKVSLVEIAKIFNKKDHTTIIYILKKVKESLPEDESMRNEIDMACNHFK